MGNVDQRMLEAAEEINEKFSFAAQARKRFASGDLKTKRQILMKLGSHLILMIKTLRIESPLPFMTIKKMKKEAPVIAEMLALSLVEVEEIRTYFLHTHAQLDASNYAN